MPAASQDDLVQVVAKQRCHRPITLRDDGGVVCVTLAALLCAIAPATQPCRYGRLRALLAWLVIGALA